MLLHLEVSLKWRHAKFTIPLGVIPLKNSPVFYVKFKKNELSYMIHLKFNLSDTHISWKWYLIGNFTPKTNIHLMAHQKKQTV
jgi:hypothetical protein